MKMLMHTLMTHPVVRATATVVAKEIAEVGLLQLIDKSMDRLAYNIAARIYENETREKAKLIETKETK